MPDKKEETKEICGIVMPISATDGCNEAHWGDVREILTESIDTAGFEANMVSDADDVGIIQKRIVQNLYDNPVVVCDVSGKNPNVMFELGLRLAFDRPTIIVKDDVTSYTFDTSAIEHLEYPRDLRFNQIVDFKRRLAQKISATSQKAATDPNYTTFLKHFGEFKIAKLDKKEVSAQEFILEELKSIKTSLRKIDRKQLSPPRFAGGRKSAGHGGGDVVGESIVFDLSGASIQEALNISQILEAHLHILESEVRIGANNENELVVRYDHRISRVEVLSLADSVIADVRNASTPSLDAAEGDGETN